MEEKLFVLQNLSLQILSHPSPENVQLFLAEVHTLDNAAVAEFQTCLLFPPISVLRKRQTKQQRTQELCLQVLHEVLLKSNLMTWTAFRDIIGCLCVVTNDFLSDISKESNLDEIFAVLLMDTSSAAFRSIEPLTFLTAFCDAKELRLVSILWSNVVLYCVEILGKSTARSVRISALRLLKETTMEIVDSSDSKIFFGSLFARFLPGVTGACISLMKNPEATAFVGQHVLSQMLETLSSVLCVVYEDSQESFGTSRKVTEGESHAQETVDSALEDPRNSVWLKETVPKISLSLRNLSKIAEDDAPQVRLSLINFTRRLAASCSMSLNECLPTLIRILIPLTEDSFPSVSTSAIETLQFFQTSVIADDCAAIWGVLQEDFVDTMESLPYLAANQSEEALRKALKSCCGYCELLGIRVSHLLSSGDIMERFVEILICLNELDYRSLDLMENSSDNGESSICNYAKFSDQATVRLFKRLLDCLGKYGLSAGFVHHLCGILLGSPRNGAIMLSNGILEGAGKAVVLDRTDCIRDIASSALQLYISSDLWNFSTSTQAAVLSKKCVTGNDERESTAPESSMLLYKQQVADLCLLMDGVVVVAQILGLEHRLQLHSVLYLLLEKTVSEVPMIQTHALTALTDLAQACSYASVADLIVNNMDYLVNAIVIKIRHLHRHPKTVFVLQAALNLGSAAILPYIWKIVAFILDNLDNFHDVAALPFLSVLVVVINKVKEWHPPVAPPLAIPASDHLEDALKYLRDGFHGSFETTKDFGEKENIDLKVDSEFELEPPMDVENDDEAEPEVPQHVTFTVQILQRCAYLLPIEDRHLRSVTLDVIREGFNILSSQQKQLLPLIHKVWNSIILLHRSSDLVILKKAFLCLVEMTAVAGSFLRHRVTTDIIPIIARFLGQEAKRSCNLKANADEWNSSRRLIISFLTNLAILLKNIDAEDSVCEIAATSVLPYLMPRQPDQLREKGIEFFQQLALVHPDLVFLKLLESSNTIDSFEISGLPSVKVQKRQTEDRIPSADVQRILQDISSFHLFFHDRRT